MNPVGDKVDASHGEKKLGSDVYKQVLGGGGEVFTYDISKENKLINSMLHNDSANKDDIDDNTIVLKLSRRLFSCGDKLTVKQGPSMAN